MEWVLILIIMQNYPASVDTIYKGGYSGMVECFEEREILVDRFKLKGPQAVCISVDIKD